MRRRTLIISAFTLLIAAGCSDDSTDPTDETPAIDFSLGSTSISVPRGQSKTFPVTITRSGGFTGTVSISVTGLPSGLSAGCSPSTILGSSTTLTVVADPSLAVGAFSATMRATGAGATSKTVIVTINVTS